jgi:hypothetical protein
MRHRQTKEAATDRPDLPLTAPHPDSTHFRSWGPKGGAFRHGLQRSQFRGFGGRLQGVGWPWG